MAEIVIMATKEELSRLRRHPELFPDKDTREKFWGDVGKKCNKSLNFVLPKQKAREHAHKMFEATIVNTAEMRTPEKDMQRGPWEQFLHNRAPGTDANLSMFAEEGTVQIIPMAASRMLMTYVREHQAIIRDIDAVSTLHLVISAIFLDEDA